MPVRDESEDTCRSAARTSSNPEASIRVSDRAVYLPEAETLVCADLHLGRGASSAVEAPIDAVVDIAGRIEALCARFGPETVVVAGDLLDDFSRIPPGVHTAVTDLVEAVESAGASVVVTPGNHDRLLQTVYDGESVAEYALDDGETVVCHGHREPETQAARYVVGHDHPAISIEGRKLPCVLYGQEVYEPDADASPADVVVCPAFTPLARGTTINARRGGDFQSPLLSAPGRFHPVVRDETGDETFWFPALGSMRGLL